METTSVKELSKIITSMNIQTLYVYMSNYKFNKFKVNKLSTGINARFFLTRDLLNTLYTLLWMRNRVKAAEKLKKYFEEYDVEAIEYEVFVCEKEH